MKVELLYFGGCPGHERARRALEDALAHEGIRAKIKIIAVDTVNAAQEYEFPGSPTIRIDGRDIFPVQALVSKPSWHPGDCHTYLDRSHWQLCCRIYETSEGRKNHPTTEMIRKRLIDR